MRITTKFFENKSTLELAKELIGKVFTYETNEGILKGIINETEAYTQEDESCHAFNGKRTKRNEIMFKKAGHLYIYFTYGMYYCANIVTGKENKGEAVLIRSVIPIKGKDIMIRNRKNNSKNIANGPSKLCMAYKLSKEQNGIDLTNPESKIYLEDLNFKPKKIIKTTRIGISKATHLEWRYICNEFDNLK